MSTGKITMRIEGIVQPRFLDSICLSHRVCIVATDGHVHEVEPNYVGLYLERFVGHHVVAQVEPVTRGNRCGVVRILSVKVFGKKPMEAKSGIEGVNVLPQAESRDQILCESETGGTTSCF
jgi:hypothetical protein